ncbi:MAG: DUF3108 domain-containing protein [Gammaproteobacteria bacterium]|nr:DUF3108 domain-containing protein [Gammaproteobacteria bacterium]MCZ6715666.1 DUF3108 domain-containing protein [Gammaproteobacteria bacterium]
MSIKMPIIGGLAALLATISLASVATDMPPVQQPLARPALQPFSASYKVLRGKKRVGVSKVELIADTDGMFVYRTRVSARGLARLFVSRDVKGESRFTLENDLPFPLYYSSYGAKKNDIQRISFEPFNYEISSQYKGAEKTLQWSPGVLDLLSMEIAMKLQFSRGEIPTEYTVAEKNSIREYHLEIEDRESIQTPFGQHETIRIRRQKAGSDNHSIIWLAPELDYLMVRFDKYKRGKIDFSIRLNNYNPAPAN